MENEKLDTIIVAAHQDSFEDTFLAQNCWYEIILDENKINDIKYIAAYRTSPTSAITHIASVDRIEKYKDTEKYVVYFSASARRLASVISAGKRLKQVRNIMYTTVAKMLVAKSLDDL